MNVLMLATVAFEPPLDGGALRTWHSLRQVARCHRVLFLGMHLPGRPPTREALERIAGLTARVEVVERPAGLWRRVWHGVASLGSDRAYPARNYQFAAFAERLQALLREERVDLVHAHHVHTAQYQPLFQGLPGVYEAHNVYSELWRGYGARPGADPLRKAFALRQAALVEALERRVAEVMDVTTACSEADRDRLLRLCPGARVRVMPNGVDCAWYRPADALEEPDTAVFTAGLDSPANIDACQWFVRDILPALRQRCPRVRFVIVGRRPPRRVRALERPGVTVAADVADVRPHVARASVCVAPLRMGSGTRLKVLEALAMGKSVVATTLGAEGLACRDGEHVVLADTATDFAAAVARLFRDEALRRRLGAAGRALVLGEYDWDVLGAGWQGVYEDALRHFHDVRDSRA